MHIPTENFWHFVLNFLINRHTSTIWFHHYPCMMRNIIFSNYWCWLGKWIALYPHLWSGVSDMLSLTFSLTLLNNYSCSPLAPLHTIFSSTSLSLTQCQVARNKFYLGYVWDNLKRKITFQAMSDFMTAIVNARRL